MNFTKKTSQPILEVKQAGITSFLARIGQFCFLSALALGLAVVPSEAGIFAYITTGDTVSVVDTATDTVVANIPVGGNPFDVVVHPDRTRVYVANRDFGGIVSVIDTGDNTIVATIPVGGDPVRGMAVHPDGTRVYLGNIGFSAVSVINTATNTVVDTVDVDATEVEVHPDGTRVYVLDPLLDDPFCGPCTGIFIIDITTNAVSRGFTCFRTMSW